MFLLRQMVGDKVVDLYEVPTNPNRFPDNTLALGKMPKHFDEIMYPEGF